MKNTTLCYIENERGEYLMLHRVKKQNDPNHDKWIGVGGKFEPGESRDRGGSAARAGWNGCTRMRWRRCPNGRGTSCFWR